MAFEYWTTLIIFILGILFFISAVWGLQWAAKNGQFKDLEKGARSIFNEVEPEGIHTDSFPTNQKLKKFIKEP
jgi:nitrogen fixation-related uncharacterized protein